MKISTKKGDRGETSLLGGKRVGKDDPRVAVNGDIDELNASVGAAAAFIKSEELKELLAAVQRDLFTIGANLSASGNGKDKPPELEKGSLQRLEKFIDDAERRLPPLKEFILPGGSTGGAMLHQTCAVARRAERNVVALSRTIAVDPTILVYLNRLSDMLFMAARVENDRAGAAREPWHRNKKP
ncbi:MAG: ATP:cob(I)alamin adenosyltransferase [Planctomycetes bacterium RBG_16_59_8]|nr:MAG: ATP:cob(I)alamin adenosyltransferase [Planctomycetes bacterium RBG_16_59_8]